MSGRVGPVARDHLLVPEKKRLYNERHFSAAAPRYDLATRAMSLGRDGAWKRLLVASLPDLHSPACVDLACGTGDVSFLLARRYPAGRIVGLDITEPMLSVARGRNRFPNVRFARRDLCDTGLPDGCADIVTGSYALRNAPDLGAAIDETGRILKPGGVAAFLDFANAGSRHLRAPRRWLLTAWCGFWGLVLHGNPGIHGYIGASLSVYPDPMGLRRLFGDRGFELLGSRRFFGGITGLIVLRKAGGPSAAQ